MRKFPTDFLIPTNARLSGPAEAASMEIKLERFSLDHLDEPIETSIRLDGIQLPNLVPLELSGEAFDFPINPTQGYIDGSIYIGHAHHPVDVTSVSFGRCDGNQIEVEVVMKFIFDFEGLDDFSATDWVCRTNSVIASSH
ncbi:hypothetical protein [Parasphingorhabdus sp.]|uniref:hypothetical protein n=1 Tax=Parasphingorhabdus sp. TaxID=2709688 RepID=UPI003265AD4C